jgi:hypothetical protein
MSSQSWLRSVPDEDLNDLWILCYVAAGDDALTPYISGKAVTWCSEIQIEQERRYAESQKAGSSIPT